PQQNGVGVVLRRKPAKELCDRPESDGESCEWMEARKSLRPPLSPKPSTVTLRKSQAEPTSQTRKVPLPGPVIHMDTAQSPETKRAPPPVSPKPRGPPTAPKPAKVAVTSTTMSPSPVATSPAAASPSSTPRSPFPVAASPLPAPGDGPSGPSGPSLSTGLPLTTPSPAQSPSTPSPHPVKPPRSSIAGLSIDLLGGGREAEEEKEKEEEEEEKEEARKREEEEDRRRRRRRREKEERKNAEEQERERRRAEEEPLEVEQWEEVMKEEVVEERKEVHHTSASPAATLQAVEQNIQLEEQDSESQPSNPSTVSILDDIGSMFDDLADQLDAMLD
ncbi:hypothetical protein CRUP_008776, partial [Coryphaenoides rupestris]